MTTGHIGFLPRGLKPVSLPAFRIATAAGAMSMATGIPIAGSSSKIGVDPEILTTTACESSLNAAEIQKPTKPRKCSFPKLWCRPKVAERTGLEFDNDLG